MPLTTARSESLPVFPFYVETEKNKNTTNKKPNKQTKKNLRNHCTFLFHYFCDGMGVILYSSYPTKGSTCLLLKTCDTKTQINAASIAVSICVSFCWNKVSFLHSN